jgi:SAM-dependent methyltransferase
VIEANNPDIDVAALERRILTEMQQPERLNVAPLPIPDVAVTHATPDIALTEVKHRLRAIPVLGSLLSVLNRWRRRTQAGLLAVPYIGYGLRWLKSLALVHETRSIVIILTRELGYLEQRLNMALELLEQRLNTTLQLTEANLAILRQQVEHEKKLTAGNREEIQFLHHRLAGALGLIESRLAALGHEMAHEKKMTAGSRAEILFQQRRLTAALETGGVRSVVSADSVNIGASMPKDALDSYYAAFEVAFHGSREEIKGRQKAYLDRVAALATGLPVLDIGCGRGEWIELLTEQGIAAYGIDMNSVFVADAKLQNLDIREAEALAHLRSLPDASLAGLTGFHIIEHLELNYLINIIDEANRVLAPGGFLLFETPNPENIIVGSNSFWADPTHRAPVPPSVARFMVEHRGFVDTEVIYLHPDDDAEHLAGTDPIASLLNQLLYGARDYAIWARKV